MAVLKLCLYGNDVLRKPAEPVHKISAKIQKLVTDMFDTMYAHNGVGLAAPQVGESKRIFVLDCSTEENPLPQMVFINPKIVRKKGACISHEGCLSFPEVFTEVKRYDEIIVKYMDMKGRQQSITVASGSLLCRAIQHEIDHLDGVLFVDHVIDEEQTAEKLKSSQLPPMEPQKRIEEPELSQAVEALKASGAPVHID
jgi:peptide deformylase